MILQFTGGSTIITVIIILILIKYVLSSGSVVSF